MARNLVICCDGTSNEFKFARTNVAKLTYVLEKDASKQLLYYHPGLGTMAAPGLARPSGTLIERVGGLALGYGLRQDVRDAYVFLMNHWEPGMDIYLFGFSRGAYTARALASLVAMYGLLMPGNEPLVPYIVRMMWRAAKSGAKFKQACDLAGQFKSSLSRRDCRIHFLGVWDTVSSVGWIGSPLALPYTKKNPIVDIARHAVSLDERRAFFRPNLLQAARGQDLAQVWFPGEHCDVGGGWPEDQSGLSKYALEWMMLEAENAGLKLDATNFQELLGRGRGIGVYAAPDPTARLHDAMWPAWWLCEFIPKRHWDKNTGRVTFRPNLFRRRHMDTAPVVHDVAWQIPQCARNLPPDAVALSARSTKAGPLSPAQASQRASGAND